MTYRIHKTRAEWTAEINGQIRRRNEAIENGDTGEWISAVALLKRKLDAALASGAFSEEAEA